MDSWLIETMGRLGSDAELSDADATTLLKIAKIAAHEGGERTNAPLLCYLIGRVQGDRGLDEILEAVRSSS
ncbi:MAG TPA: DUF6457 domain-containing protein [Gaiellaceae bacterium]|jgi:hypothetical protein